MLEDVVYVAIAVYEVCGEDNLEEGNGDSNENDNIGKVCNFSEHLVLVMAMTPMIALLAITLILPMSIQ